MNNQPICEECEYKYSYIGSEAELSYAKSERLKLLNQVKETLQNIQFYHNTSSALKKQNHDLLLDVQNMKSVLHEHRKKELQETTATEKTYQTLLDNNKSLESKLVQLKIEYANKAQEVEELKDTIEKVNSSIKVKDSEIMRLNKELEKVNLSSNESEDGKPPRQTGSPKAPVFLLKRKN